jgi:hypothetical protein
VRVWREYFPDQAQAPALAFVPSSGIMFDGPLIEIDPSCVARGRRDQYRRPLSGHRQLCANRTGLRRGGEARGADGE